MKHRWLFPLLMSVALPAHAINKCTDANGKVTYTDGPCKVGKASTVNIQKSSAPSSARHITETDPNAYLRGYQKRQDLEGLASDIAGAEDEISRLQAAREAEIAALHAQGHRARNNLAGATFLQSLAEEQSAVAARYETSIQVARDNLTRLQERRAQLEKP